MSRLRNAPRVSWFIAGVCVAALLVPTTVGAVVALKYTGIEGSSTNKADVTGSGQLLTTEADPHNFFTNTAFVTAAANSTPGTIIYASAAGSASIVTSLHVDVWGLTTTDPYITLYVGPANCSSQIKFLEEIDPSANGMTAVPYSPGQVIPAGDALCAGSIALSTYITAVGYSVPAAAAPTLPTSTFTPAPKKG